MTLSTQTVRISSTAHKTRVNYSNESIERHSSAYYSRRICAWIWASFGMGSESKTVFICAKDLLIDVPMRGGRAWLVFPVLATHWGIGMIKSFVLAKYQYTYRMFGVDTIMQSDWSSKSASLCHLDIFPHYLSTWVYSIQGYTGNISPTIGSYKPNSNLVKD